MKSAVITGVTGQDGAYLSQLLLEKDYRVIGLTRSYKTCNMRGLINLSIADKITMRECDLLNLSDIRNILIEYQPCEIYNLSAQSSVSESFSKPVPSVEYNTISVINILDSIRQINSATKFYQASSSEMFGLTAELPLTETSAFHPVSPYAISKAAAHWLTVNYRESYGLYACSGILFNHESPLRGDNFIVRKLVKQAVEITRNQRKNISVGNLEIRRDFGYAPNYIEAVYLMMQQDKADDYIVCMGKSVSLKEIAFYIFDRLSINHNRLVSDPNLFRPSEIDDIYGNPEKAEKKLGWKSKLSIYELLDLLIKDEILKFD